MVLEVQKRLEDELLHAQKMESMGRLAGGIAHDFNNILMTISGSLELATMELDDLAGALAGGAELDVEPVKVLLDDAGRAATRAASLTQQLLAFARRQVVEPQPTDLGASIEEAASMLARVLPSTIDLRCEVERGLHPVLADPAQLNQILLNLALNARDALPRGGSIEIRARNRSVAAGELSSHDGPVMVGDYVELCVEDDGVGIDSQLIPQLFEPFLTTKSAGKGTGLGLATCYGIVRQLGGAIRVSSALDRGTCFELLFPRAHTSIARPVELAPHSHELAAKTIWVVDDDPAVRDTVCAMLARFGHEVRSSSDGAAALAELSRTDLAIDLLITDVLMTGLDGVELVARLGDRLQGVETLFMSGYPAEHHQDLITQRRQFLRKPFSPQELAQQLLRIFAPS